MARTGIAHRTNRDLQIPDCLPEAFDGERRVLLRPLGWEGVTTWAVEGKGKQRDTYPLAVELPNRPGDPFHEVVPGRKAVDEDRHGLALDPQVQCPEQGGLIVSMASILVPDILEDQRVHALPAPLRKPDTVGREPAFLDVDAPGRRK